MRLAFSCALATLAAAGCFQKLDSGASSGFGSNAADPDGGIGARFPVNLHTPPIAKTSDPQSGDPTSIAATACEKVLADSVEVRDRTCKKCHEGDGSLGAPLTHILVDDQLINVMASQTSFPGWRYLVPGDPEKSLIYHRAAVTQDMPKKGTDVTIVNAGLTISDMSVLRAWIMCLAPSGGATGTGGATGSGGAAGAPGSDAGDAGAATPCTGINSCNAPTAIASLPFNAMISAAQAQGGVCYETTRTVTAVDCSNAAGRRISVNGNNNAIAVTNGTCNGTVPATRNGGFCIQVTFGGGVVGQQTMTLNISGN